MWHILFVMWIAQAVSGNTLYNSASSEELQTLNDVTESELSAEIPEIQNDAPEFIQAPGNDQRTSVRTLSRRLLRLENQLTALRTNYRGLRFRIKSLEDSATTNYTASPVVAFHASWVSGAPTSSMQVLKYTSISLNVGNAYSNVTGKFTAPRAGIYYFAVTNTPGKIGTSNIFELATNEALYSLGYNTPYEGYYSQSTIQGIIHLNAGQEIWVKASHFGDVYNSEYCTFSGFLLASDN